MEIRVKWFYRLGFLLLLFIVLYIFFRLQPIWLPVLRFLAVLAVPFAIGGFIAYLLHPVVEWLHTRGMNRGIAVVVIYLLFFGGVGLALYKGIPVFLNQVRDLADHAPEFAEIYRQWILGIEHETSEFPAAIREKVAQGITGMEKALEQLLSNVITAVKGFLSSVVLFAIIPFIAFYMLKDFSAIQKFVWYMTPRALRKEGKDFLRDVDDSLGSYIRGQLLVCLTIGVLSSLLFFAVGMPYSLLLGFIVGITNVIPYFGPVIGAIPAVMIAATISLKMVMISLAIVFSLQFIEANILSPFVVGKSLHMHPLVIMLALLAGGEAAGVMGLILAVPVLVVLKTAFVHAIKYIKMKRAV